MLKITYSETGLHLEHLTELLEEWIASRVILALRTGQSLVVQQSAASLLLPNELAKSWGLELVVREAVGLLTLCNCDAEHVEVSLKGTWISSNLDDSDGVFIAILSRQTELALLQLWQESQTRISSLGRS